MAVSPNDLCVHTLTAAPSQTGAANDSQRIDEWISAYPHTIANQPGGPWGAREAHVFVQACLARWAGNYLRAVGPTQPAVYDTKAAAIEAGWEPASVEHLQASTLRLASMVALLDESTLITYATFAHEAWHLRPSTIDSYISAIAHAHRMQGWEHFRAGDGLLKLVLNGCRRLDRDNGVGPRLRVGISGTMLGQMISRLDLLDYRAARFAAYAVFSYFGGFRANELISTASGERLHWDDLTFQPVNGVTAYMLVRQWISKTRQFGPTVNIPVCRTNGVTCPVALMRHYMGFHAQRPGGRPIFTDLAGKAPYSMAQALADTRHYGQVLAVSSCARACTCVPWLRVKPSCHSLARRLRLSWHHSGLPRVTASRDGLGCTYSATGIWYIQVQLKR